MPPHRTIRLLSLTLAGIVLAVALPACEKAETPPAPPADPAAITAKLAQADAADGATDKVVSQCLMCALRMKGDAAQAVEYQGYALHLCSSTCKQHFQKDPAAAIAATDISTE